MPIQKPKSSAGRSKLNFLRAGESSTSSWCFYGDTRTGKTRIAATAAWVPEMSPVLLVDGDRSAATILGDKRFAKVDIVRISSFKSLNAVYDLVSRGPEVGKYKTIILDELVSIHQMCMDQVMRELHAEHPDRDDVPSMREWGIARSRMLRVVKYFRDLPNTHLIVTSLARWLENDLDKRVYIKPALPGQLNNEIPALVDVLVYLDYSLPKKKLGKEDSPDDVGRRMAHFVPTRRYLAGVRGDKRVERFAEEAESPTMVELFRMYTG